MIRTNTVNPKYFFRYIWYLPWIMSIPLTFLPDSHPSFPRCSLPTSAFIFLILFTYSLTCWYCSGSIFGFLTYSHSILTYCNTPGTRSIKYTPVAMKSMILMSSRLSLELSAQIFKCLPLFHSQVDQVLPPKPSKSDYIFLLQMCSSESHRSISNTSIYLVSTITEESPCIRPSHSMSTASEWGSPIITARKLISSPSFTFMSPLEF